MKIRHVLIENFKSIKRFEHSFVNELTGQVRPVTAIFGDNGSGKTSVLQAIALVVSLAIGKTEEVKDFKWHGFLEGRLGSLGETHIKIELEIDEDELKAEIDFFQAVKQYSKYQDTLDELQTGPLVFPRTERFFVFDYKSGNLEVTPDEGSILRTFKSWFPDEPLLQKDEYVNLTGDVVYWYDQNRHLGSSLLGGGEQDWETSVANLRDSLIGWWYYHQQFKFDDDVIVRLERALSRVFPSTRFLGTELMSPTITRPRTTDWYFLLERENTRYDISEMSSGEQAVFSLLYDFVSNRISRSIILIDELELHLHPPEQQAFYNSLRKIGPDCQFIITSHSPYLRDIISPNARIRLEGGQSCL